MICVCVGNATQVFAKLCASAHDEKVKASAFFRDSLQHKIQDLQRSETRALQSSIKGRFKNTADFMKKCDEALILNHSQQRKEDVLKHFLSQVESYRSWAEHEFKLVYKVEVARANEVLQIHLSNYLRQWSGAMHDLSAALEHTGKSINGLGLKPCKGFTCQVTTESIQVSSLQFFQRFLSTGMATLTINARGDVVKAATSYTLDLPPEGATIPAISQLDIFVGEIVRILNTELKRDYAD